MKTPFLKGVVLGSVISFAMLTASAAFAGSGVGAIFNLGRGNSVNASTGLTGSTNANMLGVKNVNTGANAGGIGISVASGKPPLRVNSSTKVSNLNADLLDGQTSAAFVTGGGHIASARLAPPISDATSTLLDVPTFGALEATCAPTGFQLSWRNLTSPSTSLDVWISHDGVTDFVVQTAANDANKLATHVQGDDLFNLQVGSSGHTATITTSAHWTPTGCVFDAQAVMQ